MGEVKNFADYAKPETKKYNPVTIALGLAEIIEGTAAASVATKLTRTTLNTVCDVYGLKQYKFGVKMISYAVGIKVGSYVMDSVDPIYKHVVKFIDSVGKNKEEKDGGSEDGEHQTEQSQVKGDE